jgi:hypothetical protein
MDNESGGCVLGGGGQETVGSGQELPSSGVMTLSTKYQSAFDNKDHPKHEIHF